MKRLRDLLIVIVLGGVVIWFVAQFVGDVHHASVQMSTVVSEAETACILDEVICHAGYDSFQSEEGARAYLNSPLHLAAVKARDEKKVQEEQDKKYYECLTVAKGRKQLLDCDRLKQGAKKKTGAEAPVKPTPEGVAATVKESR
jgi:hypothetical protein